MKKWFCLLILSLSSGLHLYAQTGETELYNQLKWSDKKLSRLCDKFSKKLCPVDRAAFIQAQADWSKYRISNAKFKSMEDSEGGVIAHKMSMSRQIEMTEARIQEIEAMMNDF